MKKPTCVYVEEDVVKACKEQGINMSQVCEKALRSVLVGQHFRDEEAHLDFLRSQLIQEKRRLQERVERAEISESRIRTLEEQIKRQKELVDLVRRSREVASIILSINDIIQAQQFNVEESWKECQPLVEELAKLKHPVDREWFVKQVERLQSGFLD